MTDIVERLRNMQKTAKPNICQFINGGRMMPINKVKGGFKFGQKGKTFKKRSDAVKQAAAIKISQKKRGKPRKS